MYTQQINYTNGQRSYSHMFQWNVNIIVTPVHRPSIKGIETFSTASALRIQISSYSLKCMLLIYRTLLYDATRVYWYVHGIVFMFVVGDKTTRYCHHYSVYYFAVIPTRCNNNNNNVRVLVPTYRIRHGTVHRHYIVTFRLSRCSARL